MIITNKLNLPQAFVDLVQAEEDNKEHDPKKFGVTTLLKPTREILLSRRHEIEIDVSDCINKLFGTAFHSLIEKHDKTGMSELELEEKVLDDYVLRGRLDLYDEKEESVIDYKTGTVWKVMFKDFDDWYKQGMMYAWLQSRKGYIVRKVKFYVFLKDWTAREARNKPDYPQSQIYVYEFNVKLSDLIFIEGWLTNKFMSISEQSRLSDDELAPCSDQECWYTGDKWAVYKNVSDAKAQRVFDTREEAEGYLINKMRNQGIVVFRQGEYRKCQDYCEVCNFCKYYKIRGGK